MVAKVKKKKNLSIYEVGFRWTLLLFESTLCSFAISSGLIKTKSTKANPTHTHPERITVQPKFLDCVECDLKYFLLYNLFAQNPRKKNTTQVLEGYVNST